MDSGPKTPIPGLGLLPNSRAPDDAVIDASPSALFPPKEDHDPFESSIYDDEDTYDDQADNGYTLASLNLDQLVDNGPGTTHVVQNTDIYRQLIRLEKKLKEVDDGQNVANQRALEALTKNLAMGDAIDALRDRLQVRDAEQKAEIKAVKDMILKLSRRIDHEQRGQESYRQCFVTHEQVEYKLKKSAARFEDRSEVIEGHMGEMQVRIDRSPSRGDIRSDLVVFFVVMGLFLVLLVVVQTSWM